MAFGLKTFDRSGALNLDTTSSTWVQIAVLDIPEGSTATTTTFSGANLPPGMEIKCALQIINDLPLEEKQLVPTVTTVNTNDASRAITIQTTSGTSTNTDGETGIESYSAACKAIILGR
jgi:hypothetical protein